MTDKPDFVLTPAEGDPGPVPAEAAQILADLGKDAPARRAALEARRVTSPTPTGDAATVLWVHRTLAWDEDTIWCESAEADPCGWRVPIPPAWPLDGDETHVAHQAAVLAESGYGQVSAAGGEGARSTDAELAIRLRDALLVAEGARAALLTDLRALADEWEQNNGPHALSGDDLRTLIARHTPTTRQETP